MTQWVFKLSNKTVISQGSACPLMTAYPLDLFLGYAFEGLLSDSIGGNSVIHSHNTFPSMAQKYHQPMWLLPDVDLEQEDKNTIAGNRERYRKTQRAYQEFAKDFLGRVAEL